MARVVGAHDALQLGNSPTMSVSRSALASSAPRSASATSAPAAAMAPASGYALVRSAWVPSLLW
jgi:hypothetical protein